MRTPVHSSIGRQRGAATLVVVMSLFLVVAMLAAYASRNVVYEQRIASNSYRIGVAYETAEAGVEWALAMLNGDRINASCSNDSGGASDFRSRYLNINQSTRAVTQVLAGTNGVAACAYGSTNSWNCQCPANGTLVMPVLNAATGLQPMFSIGFRSGTRPGTAQVLVTGCTGLSSSCANNLTAAANALGKAEQSVDVALVSALKMPPVSPLVARGQVNPGSPAALGLFNAVPGSSGLLVQTGEALSVDQLARAEGTPGSLPSDSMITADASIRSATAEAFFASFFGMSSDYYQGQPKMRTVNVASACSGDCAPTLRDQIAAGAQMFWLDTPATLATNVTLGAIDNPVVVVVNGDLTISQPLQIYGLLYVRGNLSWANGSGLPAVVTGAVVTEGSITASGSVNLVYNAAVMQILNNQRGSFVRVPGSSWEAAK